MAGEDLLLKWNDHHSLFFVGAEELCQNEEYTDVTLSAGSKLFPAHKLVLSVCSPYFRQLFRRLGNDKSVIYLKDVEPRHLELLLEYMYKGEIRVEEQELVTVLTTAQGLDIRGLTESGKQDDSQSSVKMAPHPEPTRDTAPKREISTPTSSSAYESASKMRKIVPTNTDTLFKIGAVDVSPAAHDLQSHSLPQDCIPLPALTTPPCPVVKQEVANVGEDWNSSRSDHQMSAYDGNMSHDAYPETALTPTGYDHEGYEEGGYYQDDGVGHAGEHDERDFMMGGMSETVGSGQNRRGRPRKMSYTCHICGKHLRDKYNLDRHISSHYGEKNFKCDYCIPVKLFADQSNLRNHMKSKHPDLLIGEKNFSCYHCIPFKIFTDQPSLTKHMRSRHQGELIGSTCLDTCVSIKEEANN